MLDGSEWITYWPANNNNNKPCQPFVSAVNISDSCFTFSLAVLGYSDMGIAYITHMHMHNQSNQSTKKKPQNKTKQKQSLTGQLLLSNQDKLKGATLCT